MVGDEPLAAHADPGPGTEGTVETEQTLDWLPEAIAQLPLVHREVLILVAIEGMQQQEVAAVLDMPLNSVKTNLRRARLALLQELRRRNAPEQVGEHS